jgi:tetratricopeptide (TPR) repeat protein
MTSIWHRFYGRRRLFLLMLLMGVALALCSCDAQVSQKDVAVEPESHRVLISDIHLQDLIRAISRPQVAASLDLGKYPYIDLQKPLLSPPDRAVWPLYAFMMGEVYRLRGESDQAKQWYQSLVVWAAANPYKDKTGGSSLVSIALWRWLQIADPVPSHQEGEQIIKLSSQLMTTPLVEGTFETPYSLIALPQLQEEILRSLVSLAWNMGKRKQAQGFFLNYLSVARTGQLNQVEKSLLDELTAEGKFSPGKVALLLGKRLDSLKDLNGASLELTKAMKQGDTQVQAEASYHLARLERLKGRKKVCATPKTLKLLDTTLKYGADPDLVQEALYLRARLYIREGCPKDEKEFVSTLEQLLTDFPYGRRADDAHCQLAMFFLDRYWEYREDGDFNRAMELFEKIRKYKDRDDYIDSSWFIPAIAFYTRGKSGDREKATDLLNTLEKNRPAGPSHLQALFWLGRIKEEGGDQDKAAKYFNRIIDEMPYDYYAVRARMHLNLGPQANSEFLINGKTCEQLKAEFRMSQKAVSPPPTITGDTPYHLRLKRALESHLYFRSLCDFIDIKRREDKLRGKQCENIPLADLDRFHLLAPTAVLISLRQDALIAVRRPLDARNCLEIAGAVRFMPQDDQSKPYGDWPLIIYLTEARDWPWEVQSKIQKDQRYLAVAYPPAFHSMIKAHSRDFHLDPELIYSVIRHQSAFYPLAINPDGAMGLFQFIQPTFKDVDRKFKLKLLETKQKASITDFLLDPDASIYLGALYFRKELLPAHNDNLALALMDFRSGRAAARDWGEKCGWVEKDKDYEYVIEMARHQRTADFVRSVFTTMSIVLSGDILGNTKPGGQGG